MTADSLSKLDRTAAAKAQDRTLRGLCLREAVTITTCDSGIAPMPSDKRTAMVVTRAKAFYAFVNGGGK